MKFCVVQTRKSKMSKPVLSVVPSKWVASNNVYWPPSNLLALSVKSDSEPEKSKWLKQNCKLVGRANTYKSAEEIVRKLENVTDSEDAAQTNRGTRAHPAKKKAKFESKTYQLATQSDDSSVELTKSRNINYTTKSSVCVQQPGNEHQVESPIMVSKDESPSKTDQAVATEGLGLLISSPLQSVDGKQYAQLQNGCYIEVITEHSNTDEIINLNEPNNNDVIKAKHTVTLEEIDQRLKRIEAWLQKVVSFMADVSKFMELKAESTPALAAKKKKENFDQMEILFPIEDDEKLKLIENSLNENSFFEKLSRFVSSQYDLNGKRDGKAFFKVLIRKMITPNVLIPYSWVGNSRQSCHVHEPNKGFKKMFPNMVKFFENVTCEADYAFTTESVHKAFSDFLRQKHTEMKRFLDGGERRIPSSRTRSRKIVRQPVEAGREEDMDSSI
ncbi:uncharacterized protein LOC129732266 [Wyeomyia smithii]|uniref:uncharacterized protein LOC129732266 n=1 Tax=Wyeomyia smithii TaxID=174621 RepID=UPI002467E836|nr:uncharacterized protein LOC129732266 [Wyeomyia smithii]